MTYQAVTSTFDTILDFWRFGISEAQRQQLFYGHGTDNASSDILALVLGGLDLPMDADPQLLHAKLTEAEKQRLVKLLEQRINDRIPVPYLTHQAYFCGLPFYVDSRVLIPRSPIAELIIKQFSPWIESDNVYRILDLCTGSACIAIACHYAFPDAIIDASDISPDALEVASINRERHHLYPDELNLILSDGWENIPAEQQYDIIVSNPPYVGDEEMATLPKEYLHEPDMALRTDNNGLAFVDKMLANAHRYLNPQGILVVEVGNSADALMDAYPDLAFTWIDFEHGGHGVFILTQEQLRSYFDNQG